MPRNQSCAMCGASLDIYMDGKKITQGFSPFTAKKYSKGQSPGMSYPINKPKDSIL